MPAFFSTNPGTVARIAEAGIETAVTYLTFPTADAAVTYDTYLAIVTRVFQKKNVNMQFAHSVGPIIYAYSFGDRMGQFALSGHVFAGDCAGDHDGFSLFSDWYANNRASNRELPVRVALGSDVTECFLLSQDLDVPDPSTGIGNWTGTFASLPPSK